MKNKNRNERLDRISEALFGSADDLTLAEAIEDLESAGVDREALWAQTYERLCLAARNYRMKNTEVPHLLRKALEDLRRRIGPPRTREETESRADSTVAKLLDTVKAALPRALALPKLEFSSSFRNKSSEQSAKDREIIERLEKELERDIDSEEKGN